MPSWNEFIIFVCDLFKIFSSPIDLASIYTNSLTSQPVLHGIINSRFFVFWFKNCHNNLLCRHFFLSIDGRAKCLKWLKLGKWIKNRTNEYLMFVNNSNHIRSHSRDNIIHWWLRILQKCELNMKYYENWNGASNLYRIRLYFETTKKKQLTKNPNAMNIEYFVQNFLNE